MSEPTAEDRAIDLAALLRELDADGGPVCVEQIETRAAVRRALAAEAEAAKLSKENDELRGIVSDGGDAMKQRCLRLFDVIGEDDARREVLRLREVVERCGCHCHRDGTDHALVLRRMKAAEALLRRLVEAWDSQDWDGDDVADIKWGDEVSGLTDEARKLLGEKP